MTTILRTPTRRAMALAMATAAVLAACSGGSGKSASTDRGVRPRRRRRRRPPRRRRRRRPRPPRVAPTTTVPPPVYPLTGLPAPDALATLRPAIVVKIDNHTDARPQAGLNQADIVYEEIVEGITRFFTDLPVDRRRAGRAHPLGSLHRRRPARPAQPAAVRLVGRQPQRRAARSAGPTPSAWRYGQGPGFYRDRRGRNVATEHTLFNEGTSTIYSQVQPGQVAPVPFFSYRPGRDAVDRGPARDGHRRRDEQRAGPLGVGRRRRACGSAASTARPTSTRPACPSTRPTSSCSSCPTRPARPTPARRRPSRSARATRGSSRDGKLIFGHWSRPDVNKPATLHRRRRPARPPHARPDVDRAGRGRHHQRHLRLTPPAGPARAGPAPGRASPFMADLAATSAVRSAMSA